MQAQNKKGNLYNSKGDVLMDNIFMQDDDSLASKAFIIKSLIREYRIPENYVEKIHNQDLLYYGIIDLVNKGSTVTNTVLKNFINTITNSVDNDHVIYDDLDTMKGFAKGLVENMDTIKDKMKEYDTKLYHLANMKIIKLILALKDRFNNNYWIHTKMTKFEFNTRFMTPLLDYIMEQFKYCTVRTGEVKLEIVKNYKNRALEKDVYRMDGPNIDLFIVSKILDLPYCLVEISGPPHAAAENQRHFKGDRIKLAKNLKLLLISIMDQNGKCSSEEIKKVKLFGLHIYDDKICVCSLSMLIGMCMHSIWSVMRLDGYAKRPT